MLVFFVDFNSLVFWFISFWVFVATKKIEKYEEIQTRKRARRQKQF